MGDNAAGLSRRHFLMVGGGGAALVYAGRLAWLTKGSDGAAPGEVATQATTAGLAATAQVRNLPFTDSFANAALPGWNVRRPVAILGTSPFGLAHPSNQVLDRPEVLHGRGTVVGLDGPVGGSTGPGFLETADSFVFEPGATYRLRFSVAGSQQRADRLPASTVTASLPGLGVSQRVTRQPHDGFLDFDVEVPVTAKALSTIAFRSENGPGQAGLLLESVSLTRVDRTPG